MKLFMRRLGLLILTLFLPIVLLADIFIGDSVTQVKVSAREKFRQHKKIWLLLWRGG